MRFDFTDSALGSDEGCPTPLLPPQKKQQIDHWSPIRFGVNFGLRVTKSGRRSFFIWYRFRGEARRDTLWPPYPSLTLRSAIQEAKMTALDIQKDKDPQKQDRPSRHRIFVRKTDV